MPGSACVNYCHVVRVRCSLKPPDSLWRSLLIISQTKTSPSHHQLGGLLHTHTHAHAVRALYQLSSSAYWSQETALSLVTCSRCGQSCRVSHSCVPLVASYCTVPLTHSHARSLVRALSGRIRTYMYMCARKQVSVRPLVYRCRE